MTAQIENPAQAFPGAQIPPADPAFMRPRPDHVPVELIRPYPFILGAKTQLPPHSFILPIHDYPPLFWAERAINGIQGAWVPRTLDLLQRIFLDNVNFSNRDSAPFAKFIGESWMSVPSETDPPDHAVFRSMLNPVFAPKRMAALEDKIRLYAREYIARFRDKGRCEFMSEFAFEFPIKVFLELMGLPQERAPEFLEWEHKLLHEPDINEVIRGTRSVVDYLRSEIAERRVRPQDDMISFGLAVEKNGRTLTDDELVGFTFNLFIGGLDTVSTNMAWQALHLAQNPQDQAWLREDPSRIPNAIDEMMRHYAAVAINRECVNEVTIDGVTIKPGDKVTLATYLGGHDPAAYDQPETVRLDRGRRHVSFGYGPHLCIGMHLARREMRIALEELLAGIGEFRLADDADITYYLAAIMQPITLPLQWDK